MLRYACAIGDEIAVREAIRAGADPNLNDIDLWRRREKEQKAMKLQIDAIAAKNAGKKPPIDGDRTPDIDPDHSPLEKATPIGEGGGGGGGGDGGRQRNGRNTAGS